MIPITRKEKFLAKLCGEDITLPTPISREETFLAVAAGENYQMPEPITRYEKLLANLCGAEYQLVPITRLEKLIAKAAGEEIEPIEPITREEVYWFGIVIDELPTDYKRLLGFTFNNNAYFDIADFKMRGSDTLRFSFKCTMASPACNVLGAYDGTSAQTNYSLYLGSSSSAKYLRYDGSTYRSDADQNEQYDVVVTPTGSTGMKSDSTWTEKTFESDGDLCIGTTSSTATSSKMVGDIIGTITVDGRLKLIPCKRLSDNALGYYDTHSKSFYEPIGDGLVSMGDA